MLTLCFGAARDLKCNAGDALDRAAALPGHDQRRKRGGVGIDSVHTNCGNRPNTAQPDGWLKVLAPDGTPGPNLEDSDEYCRLWR